MSSIKKNDYQFEFEPLIHTENVRLMHEEENQNADEFYKVVKKSNCKLRTVTFRVRFDKNEPIKKIEDAFKINQSINYIIVQDIQLEDNNERALCFMNMLKKILTMKSQNIEHLDLQSCSIGNTGASILASALHSRYCKLKYLHLNSNRIKNEGAIAFGRALRDPQCNLEFLNLDHNRILKTGLEDLSKAVKKNIKIQELDIDEQMNLNSMAQSAFISEINVNLETNRKIEKWFAEFYRLYLNPKQYNALQKKGILSTEEKFLLKHWKMTTRRGGGDPNLPTEIRLLINEYLSNDVRQNIPQFSNWIKSTKTFSESLGVLGALNRFRIQEKNYVVRKK